MSPSGSDESTATLETGKCCGLIAPVRSNQVDVPPAALVVTQTCPPDGVRGNWGEEGKVLLLVDGLDFNELLYLNLPLGNRVPVDLIERVEVGDMRAERNADGRRGELRGALRLNRCGFLG